MITMMTGLPGNGKTLFALWYINMLAKKDGREVYYHNIKGLSLPWTEIEPDKWMDCPPGSIIVLDECQFVFPKKPNGAALPAHYDQLAVHRHKGFDIFLITQHPSLVDNFVRRLVGKHTHSVRKFGLQRSTIYEWSQCQVSPESVAAQRTAIPLKWKYPKEVFGWYKSAEVHTVKRSIPLKIVLAALFVVAVVVLGFWMLNRYQHRYDKAERGAGGVPAVSSVFGDSPMSGRADSKVFDPVADAKQYVAMNTPRVVGLPQTAPKYDELTKPVRVPIPAACIQRGDAAAGDQVSCKCYTQQGTPMDVGFNMCIDFARNGFFQDFDADRDRQARDDAVRSRRGAEVMSSRPDQPIGSGGSVLAFADVPAPAHVVGRAPADSTVQDGPPVGRGKALPPVSGG